MGDQPPPRTAERTPPSRRPPRSGRRQELEPGQLAPEVGRIDDERADVFVAGGDAQAVIAHVEQHQCDQRDACAAHSPVPRREVIEEEVHVVPSSVGSAGGSYPPGDCSAGEGGSGENFRKPHRFASTLAVRVLTSQSQTIT